MNQYNAERSSPFCTQERYDNYFLPIYKQDAILWLTDVVLKTSTISCDEILIASALALASYSEGGGDFLARILVYKGEEGRLSKTGWIIVE
eukprot:scaffold17330_cov64-Attheya_sp.AAC.1